MTPDRPPVNGHRGVALLIAMWAILVLSLVTANLVYNMRLEQEVSSYERREAAAARLARSGYEWAKFMVVKSNSAFPDESEYGEVLVSRLDNLKRGMPVEWQDGALTEGPLFENGTFRVRILPEQGRRNVNTLQQVEWEILFERAGIPSDWWGELYDTLQDWVDENDLHRLNGAEEDDAWYRERGYKPKNAPLDTVDELLLIKGWTREILYGGELEEGLEIQGIARHLTTLGDGKVNVNSASPEVLWTLPGIDEFGVEGIQAGRWGIDGETGTPDDGFSSVDEALAAGALDAELVDGVVSVDERRYLRIVSVGEVGGVTSGIWALCVQEGNDIVPLFWREAPIP